MGRHKEEGFRMPGKVAKWLQKEYDSVLLAIGLTFLFLLVEQTMKTHFELLELPVADMQTQYERRAMLEMLETVDKFTCLFAAISSLYLSDIWVRRRSREYRILRILGYDIGRLFGRSLMESGKILGVAFSTAMLLQLGNVLLTGKGWLSFWGGMASIGCSVVIVVLLQLIVMAFPFLMMVCKPLTEENREVE